jgi:hypothetical protein
MRKDEIERKRQKHNKEIVERMRRGEELAEVDMMESWFPPRPIIKKDKKLMSRLYGTKDDDEEDIKKDQPKKTSKLSLLKPLDDQ